MRISHVADLEQPAVLPLLYILLDLRGIRVSVKIAGGSEALCVSMGGEVKLTCVISSPFSSFVRLATFVRETDDG